MATTETERFTRETVILTMLDVKGKLSFSVRGQTQVTLYGKPREESASIGELYPKEQKGGCVQQPEPNERVWVWGERAAYACCRSLIVIPEFPKGISGTGLTVFDPKQKALARLKAGLTL